MMCLCVRPSCGGMRAGTLWDYYTVLLLVICRFDGSGSDVRLFDCLVVRWVLFCAQTWSEPGSFHVSQAVIRAKGVTIVTLNQRQVVVAQDQDGRSNLLSSGRYIVMAPAKLVAGQDGRDEIVSLVDLPKQLQVQRFSFFNVPQGEVCGITLPSGQVRILLPGVHIVEDCKFERFLPTVPIQSVTNIGQNKCVSCSHVLLLFVTSQKLKKEVVTSDLVTVSLEVDIATQLVDCARFLKMSAGSHGVGCKDLYDAIEESAQSHFVDTFGKTQYYNFRCVCVCVCVCVASPVRCVLCAVKVLTLFFFFFGV
jgi:hypothetical protein